MIERFILQRDPPEDIPGRIASLRRAGWGTGDIAFALVVPRGTVWNWENGRRPDYEEGRALIKLCDVAQRLQPPAFAIEAITIRPYSGTVTACNSA